MEDLISKKMDGSLEEDSQGCPLASIETHMCGPEHLQTHVHIYMCAVGIRKIKEGLTAMVCGEHTYCLTEVIVP